MATEIASRFYGKVWWFALVLIAAANEWHYPSCITVNPDAGLCLSSFFKYYDGYESAIGEGSVVEHTWVKYLDHVYDYNDASATDCGIRRQSASAQAFESTPWTRDGFSTCTAAEVATFNSWWGTECASICTADNNCRRYATFLGYHLWNNCSWDAEQERPNYDVTIP